MKNVKVAEAGWWNVEKEAIPITHQKKWEEAAGAHLEATANHREDSAKTIGESGYTKHQIVSINETIFWGQKMSPEAWVAREEKPPPGSGVSVDGLTSSLGADAAGNWSRGRGSLIILKVQELFGSALNLHCLPPVSGTRTLGRQHICLKTICWTCNAHCRELLLKEEKNRFTSKCYISLTMITQSSDENVEWG